MTNPVIDDVLESYDQRSVSFASLRPFSVRNVLLVASLYDSFTLAEDGRLAEEIFGEFQSLSLSGPAFITRVSTGEKALELLEHRRFDLVITMARVGDISVQQFAEKAKVIGPSTPLFLMAYDSRELSFLEGQAAKLPGVDKIFVWRGDTRLFLAIIKLVEDELNVDHDTRVGQVRVLILVEDSIPFYSSYLPMLYDETMKQTAALIHEGVNPAQKLLRMRARPKILHATTFEEAWGLFAKFREYVLGVISDIRFPMNGQLDAGAGLEMFRRIRAEDPYTPLLLQSSETKHQATAEFLGATFLHKRSPTLLQDFHRYMLENLGFGDFVFRMPDGAEVGRAPDLRAMVDLLGTVPAESLEFHGRLNHFSNWLMARTEFSVASALRKRQVAEFESDEDLRDFLRTQIRAFREQTRRGIVEDFNRDRFDAGSEFVRIGGGSLGGKGRGLAFAHEFLSRHDLEDYFDDLRIFVPQSAVIGTDVFDQFLEENNLLEFAVREQSDEKITKQFLSSPMPKQVVRDLASFLDRVRYPLAVRSSSLLEDSHQQPFAGVYFTQMLPNLEKDSEVRLQQLLDAIKFIYASTFFQDAKTYLASTPNRVEEEKMAVVIQQIVGKRTGDYVYPHVSGVACSYNYYPIGDMKPEEGTASVALGLGKTVVEGGRTIRFSPAHPESLPQFSTPKDILENAQRQFWALDVKKPLDFRYPDANLVSLELSDAEEHGTLWPVGSSYSPADDSMFDGVTESGVKLVTFAPILKHDVFPMSDVIQLLLELGNRAMSGPVEIEFAANLEPKDGRPKEFAFLQIRPLPTMDPGTTVDLEGLDPTDTFARSSQALGNGRIAGIQDIVAVRMDRFERERTIEIATEVGKMNSKLRDAKRPYLLLGPGRWGTADRWLGIPVSWPQISTARAILECDLEDLKVEPSQGTHFFQNMTSYGIGYFTVHQSEGGFVDWDWLDALSAEEETPWLRHIRLPEPMEILIDGRRGEGAILKRPRRSRGG